VRSASAQTICMPRPDSASASSVRSGFITGSVDSAWCTRGLSSPAVRRRARITGARPCRRRCHQLVAASDRRAPGLRAVQTSAPRSARSRFGRNGRAETSPDTGWTNGSHLSESRRYAGCRGSTMHVVGC
jgi:hypothetical protein